MCAALDRGRRSARERCGQARIDPREAKWTRSSRREKWSGKHKGVPPEHGLGCKRIRPHMTRSRAGELIGTTLEWYILSSIRHGALVSTRLVFSVVRSVGRGHFPAFSNLRSRVHSRPLGAFSCSGTTSVSALAGFRSSLPLSSPWVVQRTHRLLPTSTWGVWRSGSACRIALAPGAAIGGEWGRSGALVDGTGAQQPRAGLRPLPNWVRPAARFLGPADGANNPHGRSGNLRNVAWRIPFGGRLVLVAFGLWLRRGVEETPPVCRIEVPVSRRQLAYPRGLH